MTSDRELREEAEAIMAGAGTYRPFDQTEKLGKPPWIAGTRLNDWEKAHNHDVRLECYPEYGCTVLEVPWAEDVMSLLNRITMLGVALAGACLPKIDDTPQFVGDHIERGDN